MAKFVKPEPSQAINLIYVRAAIEANTGIRLPLDKVRRLLVEEGLITPGQARHNAQIFRGYSEFYEADDFTVEDVRPSKDDECLF
jgi:hypothetical protein